MGKWTEHSAETWTGRDQRRRRFPVGILALALALHGALLWIPYVQDEPAPDTSVTFELAWEPPPDSEPVRQPEPEPPTPLPPEPKPEPQVEPEPAPEPREAVAETPPESIPQAPPEPDVSAARLLESIASLEWKEAEQDPALARSTESELYARLSRPVIEHNIHWFDDVVVPDKAEIKDRWLDADGTHRVVMRLPNGMTVCGRQAPANDFRPWLQMPMMFGKCAGGWRKARPSRSWRDSPDR